MWKAETAHDEAVLASRTYLWVAAKVLGKLVSMWFQAYIACDSGRLSQVYLPAVYLLSSAHTAWVSSR